MGKIVRVPEHMPFWWTLMAGAFVTLFMEAILKWIDADSLPETRIWILAILMSVLVTAFLTKRPSQSRARLTWKRIESHFNDQQKNRILAREEER